MVVKTNAVDALLQTSQLAEPMSARFLKKIIVRITWVRYGVSALSSALNEAVSVAVAASRGSIRRDNAARLTRVEHLINGAR